MSAPSFRYLCEPIAQLVIPQNTKFPSGPDHHIQLLNTKPTAKQNLQLSMTDGINNVMWRKRMKRGPCDWGIGSCSILIKKYSDGWKKGTDSYPQLEISAGAFSTNWKITSLDWRGCKCCHQPLSWLIRDNGLYCAKKLRQKHLWTA